MRRRTMSETTRGGNQDRARVAGGQDHEVRYEPQGAVSRKTM